MKKLLLLPLLFMLPAFGCSKRKLKQQSAKKAKQEVVKKKEVKRIINYQLVIKEY